MKDEKNEQEEIKQDEEKDFKEEVNEDVKVNTSLESNKSKKNNLVKYFVILILLVVLIGGGVLASRINLKKDTKEEGKTETEKKPVNSKYTITSNDLVDFDLYFMKEHNTETNKVYSPISIKTALAMLADGAKGDTKDQIVSIIGDYKNTKYTNSSNMSFANAMFINNNYKDSIKSTYIENLKNKYNADVQYDSFTTPDIVNKWVDSKTFGQINNMVDDISQYNFVQVNALAIDMEWVNKFQYKSNEGKSYSVSFPHQSFYNYTRALDNDFSYLKWRDSHNVESGEFAGVINRYDIVTDLGEDTIRKTITEEYSAWLKEDPCGTASTSPDVETYVNTFIKELKESYKHVSSSTDYMLYNDDSIKAFSKDLKTYDGLTLQYVAIMPKEIALTQFLNDNDSESISKIISNLKEVKLENFNDNAITKINGNMPFFNYNDNLDLIEDLKKIGITDIFDINKSNLSDMVEAGDAMVIGKLVHKANIELTNEGIKAAAATMSGGLGSASCPVYDHIYDVPIEEIDMDFNKPFMYLLRDKKTGEIWFAGTVYEPKRSENQW